MSAKKNSMHLSSVTKARCTTGANFSHGMIRFFYQVTRAIVVTWLAPMVLLLVLPSAAFPFDFRNLGIPDALEDPLLTSPPILKLGPALPDGTFIECPTNIKISKVLSLGEAIDLALCNNPQIKQAWTQIKIQAGALGEAKSAYLPTINATYGSQQTKINYPEFTTSNSVTNGHTAYLNATWRLFDFGGRAANSTSSNLLLSAALASHDATIQKVLQSVIQSYFDVLTNATNVQAKDDETLFAKLSWEATLRREIKGVSAKSDSLQAQAALAKAQLANSRAQGDYRKAYATLIFAMGLPTGSKIAFEDTKEYPLEQNLKDLNSWLEAAQQEHPAIKAAKARRDSAQQKIIVARSMGLPTLDFAGNFYQNGYPNQGVQTTKSNTTTVGLTFSVPIFEGFGTTYKIRGAQAQVEKAQAELEDIEHQILTEIVKSHADAISSLANLESSQKLLEAADLALDSAAKRYDAGAADVLELLNSQKALAEAREERIRCVSEWRSARLRLMADAGLLGRIDEIENKP